MGMIFTGTIHGDIIKLDQATGLADGQRVMVTITPLKDIQQSVDGILSSAGACADNPEDLENQTDGGS